MAGEIKILIGQFQQESNSFSKVLCDLEKFRETYYAYGRQMLSEEGKGTEIGGALEVFREERVDVIPSVAMQACSGGYVTKDAYTHFKEIFSNDIEKNQPLDGIYLCLHGATVFEDDEDGMGRLLEDVRKKAGNVPIAVSLDFHANITKRMVQNADIIRGYQTYPHVDMKETGADTARLLIRTAKGEISPKMVAYKLPMIVQAEGASTMSGTMEKIAKRAREIEKDKDIVSVSYFQMQPWLDLRDTGCTVIVVGNQTAGPAGVYAKELAQFFWDERDTFRTTVSSFDDVLKMADETDKTIVFSDSADAPSAGSAGDSTVVLKEYLDKNVMHKAFMTVVDAETVDKAIALGVGNEGDFLIGGKIFTDLYEPVPLRACVKMISDGSFTLGGDLLRGKTLSMGKTVVLKKDNLYIVVMQYSTFANNCPDLYLSVGLDPAKAKLVMTKSPNHFKASFSMYTDKLELIQTPGASASYFWELPYKRITRPLYPFDRVEQPDLREYAKGYGVE